MKIKYIGNRRREIATARGIVVEPGEVFEVGEKLGASLLRQRRKFVSTDDDPPTDIDAKVVRQWARDNKIDVPARGRIPDDVVAAYRQAIEQKENSE